MNILDDSVDVALIDLGDTTFQITIHDTDEDLISSIKNVGLISPPILIRQPDDRYTVVCGFRRISACRSLGFSKIQSRIILSSENNAGALMMAIADNAYTRALNIIEQAVAVSKLKTYYRDDHEVCREAKKAGLNINPGLVKKLMRIHASYDELKRKMAAGIIPLTIGLELAGLPRDDAMAFISLIEDLRLTLSHQKEIITLIKEITRLNDESVVKIIHSSLISGIIHDSELERSQKINKLRRALKQIRYPEIVRFEKKYIEHLHHIKLPETIRLNPPQDFEGNRFSMHLRFSSLSEFKAVTETLNQLKIHPDFKKIIEKDVEDK